MSSYTCIYNDLCLFNIIKLVTVLLWLYFRLCVEDDNTGILYSTSGLTAESECSEDLCWDGEEDGFLHDADFIAEVVDPLSSNLNDMIGTAVFLHYNNKLANNSFWDINMT